MIRRWKVDINRKHHIVPDGNETVDFDGDYCDTSVDQKQKKSSVPSIRWIAIPLFFSALSS